MARPRLGTEVRVWLGVAAAPGAWALQHLLGFGVTEASCDPVGGQWGIARATWSAIAMGVALLIVAAGLVAAFSVYRATESAEDPPPEGRRRFLAVVGLTVSPLFACIILMSGIGSIVLDTCRQS